ncbi:restriction endonuclease subunit S [Micrococcus sp. M4NT]|uniref:restriction endonuclease subunit S n=1 Tax=Micrococcus sp. M4NT TaxID=2957501 RepID=UPI0029A9E69F|nr:restriction endonuclease subunit S [Micrococcus sp. M4NT]MDX2342005.1 restriction endonuclease subunit S [Micrococcus sp. M4NT]
MTVGDLLVEVSKRLEGVLDAPVLTLTEKNGFMLQSDRFKKRLATENIENYKIVEPGTFAFNPYLLWAGALAMNTLGFSGVASPLYPTFRAREGVDEKYLYRLLSSPVMLSHYDSVAFGSVPRRRRTSVKDFLRLSVPQPPALVEQRRIAEILDRADAQRSLRRAHLDSLDALEFSVWLDVSNRPGGSVVPLGEFVRWRSGNFLPAAARSGGDVPVHGANGVIGYTDEAMVSAPTLVVGRVGACGAVHATSGPAWVTDNALIASFDESIVSMAVLAAALRQADLSQYAVRSSQPSISGKRIAHVPISIPSRDVQREFAAAVAKIEAQRARVERALALEDELFASLQYRAFRGEL